MSSLGQSAARNQEQAVALAGRDALTSIISMAPKTPITSTPMAPRRKNSIACPPTNTIILTAFGFPKC